MGETKRRLMNDTNTAINEIREHLAALKTVFGHLPTIPRFPGQADYDRQKEYIQQHVHPLTLGMHAQYTALCKAFDDIDRFQKSKGHSDGAKQELAAHRGAKREEAIELGAQLRELFQRIEYRRDDPIGELLTLLDDLN